MCDNPCDYYSVLGFANTLVALTLDLSSARCNNLSILEDEDACSYHKIPVFGGSGGPRGDTFGGEVRDSCLRKDPLALVDLGSLYKDHIGPRKMTFFSLVYPSFGLIIRQILYSTSLFEPLTISFFYIQDLYEI